MKNDGFKKTFNVRPYEALQITEVMDIRSTRDGGFSREYALAHNGHLIKFEADFGYAIGDYIIKKNDGTHHHIRKADYDCLFLEVPKDMVIETDLEDGRIIGYLGVDEHQRVIELEKFEDGWTITYAESIEQLDVQSAQRIQAVNQSVFSLFHELKAQRKI